MTGSIIKDTVGLDKAAREKIEALQKEKQGLDARVRKESKGIQDAFKKENDDALKKAKKDFEIEIKERQDKELKYFEKHLNNMQEQFEQHKEEWVEEIFKACIES